MKLKTLIAMAVAAAFAGSFAYAAGDKASSSGASGPASAGATKSDGGAEAMFKRMDKDKDGKVSKEEAKGTPHAQDFAKLDKDNDDSLSREEHAAAPEHAGKSSAGGTSKGSKY